MENKGIIKPLVQKNVKKKVIMMMIYATKYVCLQ